MSIDKIKTGDDLTQSLDIVSDNISKLKELFPEVLTEGKIDFKVLQDILGNEIEEEEEFYRFTWAGKSQSRREAHKPSTGTLRPCKEESVDWDTTQNLYIEGDNLEVLKLLQKSYSNKVKMIYIDPPYNTGKDFIYKDNYKDNLKNYQQVTGQLDDDGNKMSTNSESDGRYHSNWLNMMYPRLRLARNLLKDDGVIFLNIGEEEITNSEKILNEIFGESNKISIITRVVKTASNLGTFFAPSTDFILCYSKNLEKTEKFKDKVDESLYKKVELDGPRKGEIFRDDIAFYQSSQKDLRPNQKYFVECPDGSKAIPPCSIQDEIMREGDGRWRWSKETYLQNKDLIVFKETKSSPLLDEFGNKSKYNLYTKSYLSDRQLDGTLPRNILTDFINRKGADLIKKLGINFDFTKPIELIEYLSDIIGLKESDIVLDFFSGSSSTAHGIISYGVKKNEKIKYIMVQIPEKVSNSEFENISDLGKERIRRASKKIKEENPLLSGNFDTGFKVFKLDSSNIKGWDGLPDNLENSLFESQDNIKSDRREEDVLFEILLKYGLDLTLPIEEKVIEGKNVFNVGFGALFICLGNDLTSKVAEGIGQWKETLKPETCRVIFKDGGFTDVEKTNSVQTLKRFGIQEIKSI